MAVLQLLKSLILLGETGKNLDLEDFNALVDHPGVSSNNGAESLSFRVANMPDGFQYRSLAGANACRVHTVYYTVPSCRRVRFFARLPEDFGLATFFGSNPTAFVDGAGVAFHERFCHCPFGKHTSFSPDVDCIDVLFRHYYRVGLSARYLDYELEDKSEPWSACENKTEGMMGRLFGCQFIAELLDGIVT